MGLFRDRIFHLLIVLCICVPSFVRAADDEEDDDFGDASPSTPPLIRAKSKFSPDYDENEDVRNFYQVLEDILADFEYDLKNGQVKGLKQASIRNVVASENVPNSFKAHLEQLISERILQHTQTRLIQCLPCRSKRAKLSGNNVIITSPETNPAELTRIAQTLGIENFIDVTFSFQSAGMILSLSSINADSGSVVWSRSYNSETSRAAAFRRGVDYNQVDEARHQTEYEPTVMHRPTIYFLYEPDNGGYTTNLAFGYRMVERYDNRKKEVGFELDYLLNIASLAGSDTASNTLWSGFNLTLLFVHAWNFIGDVENYHQPRGSVFAAIGGTYASGFLGGLIRGGYEWRLGKHWSISGNLGYRPPATQFIDGTNGTSISGVEFGIGIGAMFY